MRGEERGVEKEKEEEESRGEDETTGEDWGGSREGRIAQNRKGMR